eukprot:3102813-Pyramimonas_sp.AAC.1
MHQWLRSCGRGPPLLFMRRCVQLGACRGSALLAVEGRPFLEVRVRHAAPHGEVPARDMRARPY